jgi:UDP-glucose 4-epimerase
MRILITGATGFIGSAFARLALSRGHRVAGLAIPGETLPEHWPAADNLSWIRGTLERAPWEEIRAFEPEACVHTAWITAPGVYLESPDNLRFRDASFDFLRSVCESGAGHVVSLGTCIEYQINGAPLSEEKTPIAPTTTYARCKNELRIRLEQAAKDQGFGLGWCRVFYPYGPGEHPSRLCGSIVRQLSANQPLLLKTPHSQKDYIYIEDLAAAVLTVVEKRFHGTINMGTGTGVSVRDIAGCLGELMGKRELIQEQTPAEADPLPYVVADASRLRGLGWRPAYDLRQGLAQLLQTLR